MLKFCILKWYGLGGGLLPRQFLSSFAWKWHFLAQFWCTMHVTAGFSANKLGQVGWYSSPRGCTYNTTPVPAGYAYDPTRLWYWHDASCQNDGGTKASVVEWSRLNFIMFPPSPVKVRARMADMSPWKHQVYPMAEPLVYRWQAASARSSPVMGKSQIKSYMPNPKSSNMKSQMATSNPNLKSLKNTQIPNLSTPKSQISVKSQSHRFMNTCTERTTNKYLNIAMSL